MKTLKKEVKKELDKDPLYRHKLWQEYIPIYGGILLGDRHYGNHGQRNLEDISQEEEDDIHLRVVYHYVVDPLISLSSALLALLL